MLITGSFEYSEKATENNKIDFFDEFLEFCENRKWLAGLTQSDKNGEFSIYKCNCKVCTERKNHENYNCTQQDSEDLEEWLHFWKGILSYKINDLEELDD
jgi:hypothetical protein